MVIVSEATKRFYRETMTQVRKDIGRSVDIYVRPSFEDLDAEIDCPDCTYDFILKKSFNPTAGIDANGDCNTCHGTGKTLGGGVAIPDTIYTIDYCSIVWGPLSDSSFRKVPVGRLEENEARLSVDLDRILVNPLDPNGDTYFDLAYKVVIDNYDYEVKNVVRIGLGTKHSCRVLLRKKE